MGTWVQDSFGLTGSVSHLLLHPPESALSLAERMRVAAVFPNVPGPDCHLRCLASTPSYASLLQMSIRFNWGAFRTSDDQAVSKAVPSETWGLGSRHQ